MFFGGKLVGILPSPISHRRFTPFLGNRQTEIHSKIMVQLGGLKDVGAGSDIRSPNLQ